MTEMLMALTFSIVTANSADDKLIFLIILEKHGMILHAILEDISYALSSSDYCEQSGKKNTKTSKCRLKL